MAPWENQLGELAMSLWNDWWEVIRLLKPAFSRTRTFLWFTVCVVGLSVRTDNLGVTSIVRADRKSVV